MEDGYFEGAVIFAFLFIIFIIICAILAKKRRKKIANILSQISDSNMQLLNTKYEIYEPNNNFLVGTSYIYDIAYEEQRVQLFLVYRRPSDRKKDIGYDLDTVYMSNEKFEEKKFQTGMCVKTLHNRAVEAAYKVKEILD
ncbi:MAG: hypothetical protein K6B70_04020 [Clostridia bacterium]|nr:hypothetical protein [Clostridia bacterium]